jgi:hypothetical protein
MEWNKKLYEHEVAPPENVWNKIAHNLDNEYIVFKDKLLYAQQTPPPDAWNNIQEMLDEDNAIGKTPVISISKFFKIAVAAAVIGIIFLAVNYFYYTKKTTADNIAVQNNIKPQEVIIPPQNNIPKEDEIIAQQPMLQPTLQPTPLKDKRKPLAALNSKIKKHSNLQLSSQPTETYNEAVFITPPSLAFIETKQPATAGEYDIAGSLNKFVHNIKEEISLAEMANSYFFISGYNGELIRVSSKFKKNIQHLNGSGNKTGRNRIFKKSNSWKNIFNQWKEKVSHSTFVPSADNFMDISTLMELLHQSNEK